MHWGAWSSDNAPMFEVREGIKQTPKIEQFSDYLSYEPERRSTLADPSPKPSARQITLASAE